MLARWRGVAEAMRCGVRILPLEAALEQRAGPRGDLGAAAAGGGAGLSAGAPSRNIGDLQRRANIPVGRPGDARTAVIAIMNNELGICDRRFRSQRAREEAEALLAVRQRAAIGIGGQRAAGRLTGACGRQDHHGEHAAPRPSLLHQADRAGADRRLQHGAAGAVIGDGAPANASMLNC
jgi:hypothetical protein